MADITPEIQQQLDAQKAQCIFCKIITGEQQGKTVYSDKYLHALLDINPGVPGHTLLLPKEHYPILPYVPPDTFNHLFGMLPPLINALKKAMLTTGANVFIANGGVAGQQAPHFLVHILPREKGDKLDKYTFNREKDTEKKKTEEAHKLLTHNLPIMMRNHFDKQPTQWMNNPITRGKHLANKQPIYEDTKAFATLSPHAQAPGHIEIYSQTESHDFEKLDPETATHLFHIASYAATAQFEGLGAHGTNIILKSGKSDDNPQGDLVIHVLPRYQNDELDLLWKPQQGIPLETIQNKIKNETWYIEQAQKKPEKKPVIDLDEAEKKIKIHTDKPRTKTKKELTPEEEIELALRRVP